MHVIRWQFSSRKRKILEKSKKSKRYCQKNFSLKISLRIGVHKTLSQTPDFCVGHICVSLHVGIYVIYVKVCVSRCLLQKAAEVKVQSVIYALKCTDSYVNNTFVQFKIIKCCWNKNCILLPWLDEAMKKKKIVMKRWKPIFFIYSKGTELICLRQKDMRVFIIKLGITKIENERQNKRREQE